MGNVGFELPIRVQLVGVYLVFASLIMPALALRRARGVRQLGGAYLTGAVGLAAGLVISAVFDLSTGPTVVAALALSAMLAAALAPA